MLQAIYTFASNNQIRWEETELLRDNFWFAHHLIYHSGNTNFGSYATADVINSLFGFHLFNFKYFKLFLDLISLFCVSLLLKRFLGVKTAIIPLLTFGLSPALLFFNSLQTPFGLDLQYFPILLYLILTTFKNISLELIKLTLFWTALMWSWLSYPTLIFYIPIFTIIFLIKLRNKTRAWQLQAILVSMVSFFIPLIFSISWIQNKELLFNFKEQHGLLIAGGTLLIGNNLGETFYQSLFALFTNLFYKATAYHYELNQVEFSGILPIFALLFIIFVPFWARFKAKEIKLASWLCLGTIILNIILSSISVWSNIGFRRNTPILMAVYGLLAINFYLFYTKRINIFLPKWLVTLTLTLLLIHHIIVYPLNLTHLQDPSPFKDYGPFTIVGTPEKSVEKVTHDLRQGDVHLNCLDQAPSMSTQECPYLDFYAAVMSACFWNKLSCNSMYGYSPLRKQEDQLNMEFFNNLNEE